MMQRARILSCACDLFLESGLDGLTMRRLARRVGVTAPALYRHFASREAILLEVVGEAFKVHAEYLYRALKGGTPEGRLQLAGQGYLDFALEHPRYYEIFHAMPQTLGLASFPEETVAQACAIGQFWNDRVRECMAAGILRGDDPDRVAATMWALAHGVISLYNRGNLEMDQASFRRYYVEVMKRGFVGIASDQYRAVLHSSAACPEGEPVAADTREAV